MICFSDRQEEILLLIFIPVCAVIHEDNAVDLSASNSFFLYTYFPQVEKFLFKWLLFLCKYP